MVERESNSRWQLFSLARLRVALLLSVGTWVPTTASAQEVVEPCDRLAEIVADVPTLVLSAVDTLVHDQRFGLTAKGCQRRLVGQVSAFRGTSPDGLLRKILTVRGWQEDIRYSADGPDGTAFAFVNDTVVCLIRAVWDGGDATDPSYVPEDRYQLVIGCIAESRSTSRADLEDRPASYHAFVAVGAYSGGVCFPFPASATNLHGS